MALDLKYPDGLVDYQAAPSTGLASHANLLSIIVLGALMALAMSGLLAGDRTMPQRVTMPGARLEVSVPQRLRNGEFFEMRLSITATAPITDMTLAVPPALWRDMTINTMIPAPSEEESRDGAFRFHYGEMKAGETLEIKIDGQINPPLTWGTGGDIALYDGNRRLGGLPVQIKVLP